MDFYIAPSLPALKYLLRHMTQNRCLINGSQIFDQLRRFIVLEAFDWLFSRARVREPAPLAEHFCCCSRCRAFEDMRKSFENHLKWTLFHAFPRRRLFSEWKLIGIIWMWCNVMKFSMENVRSRTCYKRLESKTWTIDFMLILGTFSLWHRRHIHPRNMFSMIIQPPEVSSLFLSVLT